MKIWLIVGLVFVAPILLSLAETAATGDAEEKPAAARAASKEAEEWRFMGHGWRFWGGLLVGLWLLTAGVHLVVDYNQFHERRKRRLMEEKLK
ncbi:unnamed protein product [Vitrella brassicaformis CCMP3155]|uniref:BAP29/BAP31 transmembrane domain-containing protein n=1 Tax=Vitrella brassicaformis (strain CCMP3155) TaxID=1169540 RepID=A0A0G4ED87_VITBC|nr:unnamed protein product [Vitrella brassicaformis CCMP3155]|eukprot:CEL93306.1 unnamed protein product [Vitrella brassicaformis CCMP3155]